MKKIKAFTLAEVLITLVIIGVIAAMTIPTLMGSTNRQETKSKVKKIYSMMNQALALEYALYGNQTWYNGNVPDGRKVAQMLMNHLSVTHIDDDGSDSIWFNTADGMKFGTHGGGVLVKIDNSSRWVDGYNCSNAQECYDSNPNVFNFETWCPGSSGTEHKFCPADNVAYSYIYDTTVEEAFNIHDGHHPI